MVGLCSPGSDSSDFGSILLEKNCSYFGPFIPQFPSSAKINNTSTKLKQKAKVKFGKPINSVRKKKKKTSKKGGKWLNQVLLRIKESDVLLCLRSKKLPCLTLILVPFYQFIMMLWLL